MHLSPSLLLLAQQPLYKLHQNLVHKFWKRNSIQLSFVRFPLETYQIILILITTLSMLIKNIIISISFN